MEKIRKKFLLIFITICPLFSFGQKNGWQHLDLQTDGFFGISANKAYTELLKGKAAKTVIVAVIDAGVDTAQEDLKPILWTNSKKDRIKDVHGWDFIGSANGDVHYDNLELTRQVRQQAAKFEGKDTSTLSESDLVSFHIYRKEKEELDKKLAEDKRILNNILGFRQIMESIIRKIGKDTPTVNDFQNFSPQNPQETRVRDLILNALQQQSDFKLFLADEIDKPLTHFKDEIEYQLNVDYDPRSIVGDDYFNSTQRDYGNNDITGPDATHGTHVAGIIAAIRGNGIGIDGIADHVRIMSVRTVPDGDERDKDVANAIRYATDHGAKVINMSFGKAYSQDKKIVDDAAKYAMSKDVLLVQAAGNSNEDIDTTQNFPNRNYLDGGQAKAWIVVGASSMYDDENLKASFSNYGKKAVDVFAPGVQITSTLPGNKYAPFDGTSMASPVVAGLAALIREYYPKLTAVQVKDIIMRSVVRINHKVKVNDEEIPFSDLCVSGGIVNAYQALELAAHYNNDADQGFKNNDKN